MVSFSMCVIWMGALCTGMVYLASMIGCSWRVDPVIMGVIVLAAGTSVPDLIASVTVAKNGQGSMAIANAIGSNVFDILLGLGFPWFLAVRLLFRFLACCCARLRLLSAPALALLAHCSPFPALSLSLSLSLSSSATWFMFFQALAYGKVGAPVSVPVNKFGIVLSIIILFSTVIIFVCLLLINKMKMNKGLSYCLIAIYVAFVVWSLLENYLADQLAPIKNLGMRLRL